MALTGENFCLDDTLQGQEFLRSCSGKRDLIRSKRDLLDIEFLPRRYSPPPPRHSFFGVEMSDVGDMREGGGHA
jgi:hypothetical protein